ncbi:MAG: class I SAM-dependent methyltransferase, partial [Methanobacterium sp.]|uniref:class I SAM-dependent DNA methyltransferase n=1 Tax=Methanobacterium sp. TaxID=2164 RepID=UPI003D6543F8|nr:class I SAM-dependent methyltransferase [Methanobacterium sp.]
MAEEQLYKKFARYYDKIYEKMDHQKEAEFIKWAVKTYKNSSGNELLDVACGTGRHAYFLKNDFKIIGFDISEEMLKIAREKLPDIRFINGDMKKMNLEQQFDVLICMFSAINYNTTLDELKITLNNFYNHLKEGGILIFDMGINKENWIEGVVSVDTVVDKNFKLARMCQSHLENGVFNSSFVFLVKEDGRVDFDIDEHKLGVFG